MKVRATNKYKVLGVSDSQLGFIPEEGYEFEVTEERFKALSVNNSYNATFVVKVEEKKEEPKEELKEEVVEVAKKKTTTRKAVKKTAKKAK